MLWSKRGLSSTLFICKVYLKGYATFVVSCCTTSSVLEGESRRGGGLFRDVVLLSICDGLLVMTTLPLTSYIPPIRQTVKNVLGHLFPKNVLIGGNSMLKNQIFFSERIFFSEY